jgi:hypothetical protein
MGCSHRDTRSPDKAKKQKSEYTKPGGVYEKGQEKVQQITGEFTVFSVQS